MFLSPQLGLQLDPCIISQHVNIALYRAEEIVYQVLLRCNFVWAPDSRSFMPGFLIALTVNLNNLKYLCGGHI